MLTSVVTAVQGHVRGGPDPEAVAIRYIQAARDGMPAVVRDSLAPDATWQYPDDLPLPGIYRGVDAITGEFLAAVGLLAGCGSSPARSSPGRYGRG